MKKLITKIVLLPINLLSLLGIGYAALLGKLHPSFSTLWIDAQNKKIRSRKAHLTHKVNNRDYAFTFFTPGWLCQFRANTFSTKEPETLEWINTYGGDGVLFDIGANVGLYSIYYAKTKAGSVYAFEPSVFNLALLAKNINVNSVESKVRIVPNPLTDINSFASFNMSTIEEGGAISSFGVEYGPDGKTLKKEFSYQTCGFSLDFLIDSGIVKDRPSLVKIDVDGIEHLILQGASKTLSDPNCKTVLIEVADEFKEMSSEVERILTRSGFILQTKADAVGFYATCNQIWVKR